MRTYKEQSCCKSQERPCRYVDAGGDQEQTLDDLNAPNNPQHRKVDKMDVFSRRSLLNAIVRLQDRIEGGKVCWRHANGRTFEITPDDQEPDKVRVIENEPRLYDVICLNRIWWDDPNGYEKAYRSWSCLPYQEPSIRDKSLFKSFKSRLRIISLSVEDTIDAVSDAIDQNRVYRPLITPFVLNYNDLQAEVKQENIHRIRNYKEYYITKQKKVEDIYQKSMGSDIPYFFRGLRNENGPIREDGRNCLLSFFNSPSIENWDNVAELIISYDITCDHIAWEIWISLDPSAPRSLNEDGDWPKIPDKEMFIRILETARSAPKHKRMPKIFRMASIDNILKLKLIGENSIRGNLGMADLTGAEINEAFLRPVEGSRRGRR